MQWQISVEVDDEREENCRRTGLAFIWIVGSRRKRHSQCYIAAAAAAQELSGKGGERERSGSRRNRNIQYFQLLWFPARSDVSHDARLSRELEFHFVLIERRVAFQFARVVASAAAAVVATLSSERTRLPTLAKLLYFDSLCSSRIARRIADAFSSDVDETREKAPLAASFQLFTLFCPFYL